LIISTHLAVAYLFAFGVAFVLTPALARPARRIGLIDHPDQRKRHCTPTPLTGGIGLMAGFIAGLLLADIALAPYWSLITGMLILMLIGLADDLTQVSANVRMLSQIGVAALMVYGGGLEARVLGELFGPLYGPVGLGWLAGPFTIACVVFMINAINMADGLDGLAGGMALVILVMLAGAAWMDGLGNGLITLPLLMAVATLGFLVHNVRLPGRARARAFLGDTGSMVLGYAIAWLAVAIGTHPQAEIYPISIAWIVIVPGMDTLALFFRRLHLGRSPFSPDRAHLHHIVHRSGVNVASTVHIIHMLVLLTGLFGVLAWQHQWPEWTLFTLAAMLMLGYQALLANARRILRWRGKRKTPSPRA